MLANNHRKSPSSTSSRPEDQSYQACLRTRPQTSKNPRHNAKPAGGLIASSRAAAHEAYGQDTSNKRERDPDFRSTDSRDSLFGKHDHRIRENDQRPIFKRVKKHR